MGQKGQTQILILAGIIILLAITGGIFYLGRITTPKPQPQNMVISSPQPSPTSNPTDETADWKTYTDNKYFITKYPSNWELKFKSPGGIYIYNPKSIKTIDIGFGGKTEEVITEYLDIIIEPSPDWDIQAEVNEYKFQWKNRGISISSEERSVNGVDIILYDDAGKGSYGKNIIVSNGRLVAHMNGSLEHLIDRRIENTILFTFKFLP